MTVTAWSITQSGRYEPFDLQVSRGQITNHSLIGISGYQTAISTTAIAVWENATAYAYPGSAVVMTLASSSASDTATSVLISGLDANYASISEIVALNGTTGVNTVKSYLRINYLGVVSGTAPVGTITAKNGGTTYAQINIGIGRSQAAVYTVPAGYTFYLNRLNGFTSLNGNSTAFMTFSNVSTPSNGVTFSIAQAPFTQSLTINRQYPLMYAEKTDIQFQMKTSTGTAAGSIYAEGILVKNDATL